MAEATRKSPAPEAFPPQQPVFYYDLGSIACYLAAERVMRVLPLAPEWEPVLALDLRHDAFADVDRSAIERIAAAQGLQPVRWPEPWPPDTRLAMLAATYAKRVGRGVAFSLAAFRQAFAGGRDLGDQSTALLAAAACEMHPTAVLKGVALRSVSDALHGACARARAAGVGGVPAVQVGAELFPGMEGVDRAARALKAAPG